MKIPLILTLLISLFLQVNETSSKTPKKGDNDLISFFPKEYVKAFPNPLKGFRSSSINSEDYPTLTRLYIKWNEIENSESDGVEKILNYCNKQWQQLPGRNVKVIPRVYLEWPFAKQNTDNTRDTVASDWGEIRYCDRYWPADMVRGDYTSEQFKKRLVALIAKMGKAWGNDPRVAYVEMGLIGWWGEQHSPFINNEMQKLMGDAFVSAFKTKLVMVRQAKDFTGYPFGSYWDSFAHASQLDEANMLVAQGGKWKTTVRGGEVAYDWGDMSKTGTSPDQSLKVKANRDYIIDFIRKVHCNHLGWINNYNHEDPEVRLGAEEVQKVLGYRFVLDEVSYTPEVLPGNLLTVQFKVRNTGSSPFYYNWPVEVSFLNPETRQVMWKAVFKGIDIRTWLPGDNWDPVLRKYTIEAEINTISGSFKLPENFKTGEYILALSILDPAGNVPAVRFAVKNYFKGGRHPIGNIGVNKVPGSFNLNEEIFDDLYSDRTLYYDLRDSQSNSYHPLPDSNAIWIGTSWHNESGSGLCVINDDYNLYISGDTTIDNYSYHKLYRNGFSSSNCPPPGNYYYGQYWSAFRQDIANKKVYLNIAGVDTLAYDFNLIVGDNLPESCLGGFSDNHIESIDSVFIRGYYQKRFWISGGGNASYAAIIEGIGSTLGAFAPLATPSESGNELWCVKIDNESVWTSSPGNTCGLTAIIKNLKIENKIIISPNPISSKATIKTNTNLVNATLRLFNTHGQVVKEIRYISGKTISFQRENLSNGLYLVQLSQNNQVFKSDKLIITN